MPTPSFEVHRFEALESTNDWLLTEARRGAPSWTVAVADFQQRGRGRLDRRWEAPAGSSLLCSVLLRVGLEARLRHLATVAVALSASSSCHEVADVGVGIKWPNDLVVADRKLGGILAETDGADADDATVAIVVGLGVNLTWPGPPEALGTCLVAEAGGPVDRDELLETYLGELATRAKALTTAVGRERLLAEYRGELVTIGRDVRVELPSETVNGVAQGVTDEGHLIVASTAGQRVVAAGDVVHLRPTGKGQEEPHE